MSEHNTNDGGPAFPVTRDSDPGGTFVSRGMSLREWYAGRAMQGLLASGGEWQTWNDLAADAHGIARAMIDPEAARDTSRPPGPDPWQQPAASHVGRLCWIEQLPVGLPPRAVSMGDDGRFRYWDESADIWRLLTGRVLPIGVRPA